MGGVEKRPGVDLIAVWIALVGVHNNAETAWWSVLLFCSVKEITFLAQEDASAPACCGVW
jgi:hypothetical protein